MRVPETPPAVGFLGPFNNSDRTPERIKAPQDAQDIQAAIQKTTFAQALT